MKEVAETKSDEKISDEARTEFQINEWLSGGLEVQVLKMTTALTSNFFNPMKVVWKLIILSAAVASTKVNYIRLDSDH